MPARRMTSNRGRTPSHLFFDLDGTLTDPRDGIVRCIVHTMTVLKKPIPADQALERFIGPPLARTFETLLGTTDEAVVRSAIDTYRERFGSIGIFENRVYPEIPSALAALGDRGRTLCLVTSKPTVFARRILDQFDLSRFFARIYGPELDDTRCTKASLVARALATERVAPAAAVMIGDRGDDVEAARANGVRSIGVTWGYGSREELDAAGADQVVSTMQELLACIGLGSDGGEASSRRDREPA